MPVETETLRAEVETALGAAKNPESMIRIMITRGRGELGLDPDLAENPTRVVIVSPLKTPPAEAYEQGIGVVTFRTQRLADATDAAGAKIANYLIAVLATREARQKGALEALIVDNHGKVVEGTSSNVFQVIDQKLSTPPENLGILPGITRGRVLELAGQLGIAVEHRAFSIDELCRADEVFVSSTLREILPVVRIDQAESRAGNQVLSHAACSRSSGPWSARASRQSAGRPILRADAAEFKTEFQDAGLAAGPHGVGGESARATLLGSISRRVS